MDIEDIIKNFQSKVRHSRLYGAIENSMLGWWLNSINETDVAGEPNYVRFLRRSRRYAKIPVAVGLVSGLIGIAQDLYEIEASSGLEFAGVVIEKYIDPNAPEWDPILGTERRVPQHVTIVEARFGEHTQKCRFHDEILYDKVNVGSPLVVDVPLHYIKSGSTGVVTIYPQVLKDCKIIKFLF